MILGIGLCGLKTVSYGRIHACNKNKQGIAARCPRTVANQRSSPESPRTDHACARGRVLFAGRSARRHLAQSPWRNGGSPVSCALRPSGRRPAGRSGRRSAPCRAGPEEPRADPPGAGRGTPVSAPPRFPGPPVRARRHLALPLLTVGGVPCSGAAKCTARVDSLTMRPSTDTSGSRT